MGSTAKPGTEQVEFTEPESCRLQARADEMDERAARYLERFRQKNVQDSEVDIGTVKIRRAIYEVGAAILRELESQK